MYQIYFGEYLLHDLRMEEYFLVEPEIEEEINKVSELSFDIYPMHPHFDKLYKLVPLVIVKKDGNTIFRGRIIKDSQNMDNSKQVTCESSLAFLLDSMQRPFEFQGSPEDLYQYFFNVHNTQVGTFTKTTDTAPIAGKVYFVYESGLYKQVIIPVSSDIENYYETSGDKVLYVGKMTGANLDNNDYINRSSSNYENTFDAIEDKLLDTIGGYIIERYIGSNIFIDWVDDFKVGEAQIVSTQTIEFGENLMDITAENDASETYSVVIPLGAEIENDDGTKERLTIKNVNNGKDYLVNETALNNYGWIVAPVDETTWNDVTVASNLKTKATEYLNNKAVMLKSTLELNALDLSTIDKTITDFKMGQYIKVQSTPHGISKLYLLTKKKTPLTAPEKMEITLGETKQTLTGIQLGSGQNTLHKVETILGDYVLNDDVSEIVTEEIENSSFIQQIPSQVMIQVGETYTSKSETEQLLQTINTQLTQTESGWTFQFNELLQQITEVDGTVNSNYQKLVKYIRFNGGKIILGEVGNDITLELQNDRLSFYNNNVEVAYVSKGRIYITDAEFTNSVTIGNFAFIPRSNGSLDFKKVKG